MTRTDAGLSADRTRPRWIETHLGSNQVSRVIYGAIIGLALVVALEAHPPDAGVVAVTLVGTALAVALAIAFPAVFFLMASAGWIELNTAFRLAKWTGLGLIGFYGFCGARLSGRSWVGSAANAAVVVAIGALLIALKALVH